MYGPQGETRYLINSSGAIADTYRYTAYGVTLYSNGTDFNPYRYGGKYGYYSDGSMGLMLAEARWYSPHLMRWLTRDPIHYDGGDNLYWYVRGNPVKWVDPSGLINLDPRKIGCVGEICGGGGASGAGGGGYGGGFFGSKRLQLQNAKYQPTRNSPEVINGRQDTAHCIDQMENRGFVPSVVENVIRTGRPIITRPGSRGYYDSVNNITVIESTTEGGLMTVRYGLPPKVKL